MTVRRILLDASHYGDAVHVECNEQTVLNRWKLNKNETCAIRRGRSFLNVSDGEPIEPYAEWSVIG